MDGSVLSGSNSNIRNSSGDQKHRFVATFKAQVPVRVSLCPSAMYASLRLISAAERECFPNRAFVRGRVTLVILPTMSGLRGIFDCISDDHQPKSPHRCADAASDRATVMLPKSLMNFRACGIYFRSRETPF
jgi:hypothetical protein